MLFSQQTSGYPLLSQTTFAVLSTNSAEGAEKHRKALKGTKGAERYSKVQTGTERRTKSAERHTNAKIVDI